jgi:Cu2+-exporting ATPase
VDRKENDKTMQANKKHDAEHPAMAAAHERHGGGKTSGGGHDRHAGHTTGMFRARFWVSLVLSIPVVLYSDMIQMWLGFSMPRFPGSGWVAPILGTFIFAWGGWPFLKGGFEEARERRPGMMLLISLAITVAFVASVATALGFLDLDFWWELALLVTIMLLGHWMEMRAVGQASGALEALAALLPDEAERVTGGTTEKVSLEDLGEGDVVLVRSGGRVPADGETL